LILTFVSKILGGQNLLFLCSFSYDVSWLLSTRRGNCCSPKAVLASLFYFIGEETSSFKLQEAQAIPLTTQQIQCVFKYIFSLAAIEN